MNDKSKLDEMKKLWEKEVDEYLIKAATVDLNEYPIVVLSHFIFVL